MPLFTELGVLIRFKLDAGIPVCHSTITLPDVGLFVITTFVKSAVKLGHRFVNASLPEVFGVSLPERHVSGQLVITT
jgi:hypothetical protein